MRVQPGAAAASWTQCSPLVCRLGIGGLLRLCAAPTWLRLLAHSLGVAPPPLACWASKSSSGKIAGDVCCTLAPMPACPTTWLAAAALCVHSVTGSCWLPRRGSGGGARRSPSLTMLLAGGWLHTGGPSKQALGQAHRLSCQKPIFQRAAYDPGKREWRRK